MTEHICNACYIRDMRHDEAKAFLRWVAYEFSTCLATDDEAEKLSEAMRILELSEYDQELRRFT